MNSVKKKVIFIIKSVENDITPTTIYHFNKL